MELVYALHVGEYVGEGVGAEQVAAPVLLVDLEVEHLNNKCVSKFEHTFTVLFDSKRIANIDISPLQNLYEGNKRFSNGIPPSQGCGSDPTFEKKPPDPDPT